MDKSRDNQEMRCPRLGGTISFHYCRTSGEDHLPCWKIADCWWEIFDIKAWLRENLTEAHLGQLLAKKEQFQPKVSSLLELIEKAKSRVG